MKKKSIVTVYPKSIDHISAAIVVNGYYLLLKNANNKAFKRYGYFFPGCLRNDKCKDAQYLRAQLKAKYNFDIEVNNLIGDVLVKDEGRKYSCLYLYKCRLTSKNKSGIIEVGESKYKVEFYLPEQFRKLRFDHADKLLAQRIYVFRKVYGDNLEKKQRTAKAKDAVLKMYDCLLYFKDVVAKQDILDFEMLAKSNVSIKEIHAAFKWICKRSKKVDVKKYLKWKKNCKQKGAKNENK